MRIFYLFTISLSVLFGLSCCSPKISTLTKYGETRVDPFNVSYNKLTMDLDKEPITYVIDITTELGRVELKNLSVEEARKLALVKAIMANKCATIFQPQYTHVVDKGKVLRVTLYGYPARYKQ